MGTAICLSQRGQPHMCCRRPSGRLARHQRHRWQQRHRLQYSVRCQYLLSHVTRKRVLCQCPLSRRTRLHGSSLVSCQRHKVDSAQCASASFSEGCVPWDYYTSVTTQTSPCGTTLGQHSFDPSRPKAASEVGLCWAAERGALPLTSHDVAFSLVFLSREDGEMLHLFFLRSLSV